MYGSRILILGNMKKLWYVDKCREPNSYMVEIPATGQCFRRNSNFIKPRQSEENSNSRPSAELQDSQRFQRNPQFFNHPPSQDKQSQVALLPVQWMPFPQYPQQSRTSGHQPESTKEFHLQDLDYKNDFSTCTKFYNSSHVRLSTSEREMLRYGSE